jgi:hypothetical protein
MCIRLVLILFVFALPAGAAFAQENDPATVQELAIRSLTYPGAPAEELSLFPNALPDDIPVSVTYPDSTRLIGSIRRSFETTVFISSDLSAADVMQHYYEHFTEMGWRTQQWPRWGFATAAEAFPNTYCSRNNDAWLNVMATEIPEVDTDVRIVFYNQGAGPCAEQTMEYMVDFPPMPFLTMPDGVRLSSVGQGGGQYGEFQASATMETDASLEDLAGHFIAQLEAAGWVQSDAGADATTLWRTYSMTDQQGEAWTGQFFITRLPGQPNATAYVLATKNNWSPPSPQIRRRG